MKYTNSPLVNLTKISPNKTSPRNHEIDRITPHCYVGQASVESMAGWLCNPGAQASANYGIGYDGRVVMLVEEKDRSWCSSSSANDNRAITIECASDAYDPYKINDNVMAKLIGLMTDICKRYGKTKLLWFGNKDKRTRECEYRSSHGTGRQDETEYPRKACGTPDDKRCDSTRIHGNRDGSMRKQASRSGLLYEYDLSGCRAALPFLEPCGCQPAFPVDFHLWNGAPANSRHSFASSRRRKRRLRCMLQQLQLVMRAHSIR